MHTHVIEHAPMHTHVIEFAILFRVIKKLHLRSICHHFNHLLIHLFLLDIYEKEIVFYCY